MEPTDFNTALRLVLELARQNVLELDHANETEELEAERERQMQACDIVETWLYFNTHDEENNV